MTLPCDYGETYQAAAALKAIADARGVAVVGLHHKRKSNGFEGDWTESFMGSTGFAAAADTLILLKRDRGSSEGELNVTGRGVTESAYVLDFDLSCGGWVIRGNKEEIMDGEAQQTIFDYLKEHPLLGPKEIARGLKRDEGVDMNPSTLRVHLLRMVRAGTLQRSGGVYTVYTAYGISGGETQSKEGLTLNPASETPVNSVSSVNSDPPLAPGGYPKDWDDPLPASSPGDEEHIAEFLKENTKAEPGASVFTQDIWPLAKGWYAEKTGKAIRRDMFFKALERRGFPRESGRESGNVRGLRLLAPGGEEAVR